MRLYTMFLVSLLEPCATSSIQDQVVLAPPPIQLVDRTKFEVEVVLVSNIRRNKLYYLLIG